MNKQQAIEWCKKYLESWPKTTNYKHPDDWRWVTSQKPYQQPIYKLVNGQHEEIYEEDIK